MVDFARPWIKAAEEVMRKMAEARDDMEGLGQEVYINHPPLMCDISSLSKINKTIARMRHAISAVDTSKSALKGGDE